MVGKAPKIKKLEAIKLWPTSKKIATKNMGAYVKHWQKEMKDDKEELLKLRDQVEGFKKMMGGFKAGLTPTLKALEKSKTPADHLKYAKDAKKITALYSKMIDRYPDVQGIGNVGTVLEGALGKINKEMDAIIKIMAKAA